VIVKATAGGGSHGMRITRWRAVARRQDRAAQGEAALASATSTSRVRRIARHIEFQILGDHSARWCTSASASARSAAASEADRKSPSPALSEKMRRRMGGIVIDAAKAVDTPTPAPSGF
jgi:acetyl-CoA carboxylase biotin carboxylase subunit